MSTGYYFASPVAMNPWEYNALDYHYPDAPNASGAYPSGPPTNSIIYPGIYAPSGLDIMAVLSRVMTRPSPVIDLGAVDASCALVVCDIAQPDYPIVYASEACTLLTGYTPEEMLGKNCRFMQAPPPTAAPGSRGGRRRRGEAAASGGASSSSSSEEFRRSPLVDRTALRRMRRAVDARAELAVEVLNFRKDGSHFTNVLTMIPICWDSPVPRYYVGFMAEKTW